MLPKNREEVDLIQEDSLELFSYSLLYEIEEGGNYYHDPSIPEGMPTWQYTVVPVDFDFPAVEYEILDELYFGDEAGEDNGRMDSYAWDALEEEAMRLTNNLPDDAANGKLEGKRYNPKGRIMMQEIERRQNVANQWFRQYQQDIPIRGVKVRARWSVNIRSDYTDGSGYFYIDYRFRYDVNYSIEFERKNAKVTNNVGFSLNYNGPKQRSDWNPIFRDFDNHLEWVSCTIVNALTDFNHQCQAHDIKSPGEGLLISTIKVRPIFGLGTSNANHIRHLLPTGVLVDPFDFIRINDVKVYTEFRPDGINVMDRCTDDWYRLIMHEMGHVSHYMKSPSNIILSLGIVTESWATAVEYFFTDPYYPDRVDHLPDQSRAQIEAPNDNSWKYSPFFIDLEDNINQANNNGNTGWANDFVRNYTLHQMQDALNYRSNLSGIAEHLKNNYSNSSSGGLTTLVDFYEDIENDNR
jgi:hypothetical protein